MCGLYKSLCLQFDASAYTLINPVGIAVAAVGARIAAGEDTWHRDLGLKTQGKTAPQVSHCACEACQALHCDSYEWEPH